ncbi:MAG: hypothetical protein NTW11_01030 [Candidatus Staskawiczbacteria bacterium]|nr:hypothetical protein [Candidatus Staskawiczbacteria bacterium]
MKKIFLSVTLFCLLSIIFVPFLATAAFVQCGNGTPIYDASGSCTSNCPCGICDFFKMLSTIYSFIVWDIAMPLAIIAIVIGGIMMMISAGNPDLMGKGKTMLKTAIIGLVLVLGSWIIINLVLTAIGYKDISTWSSFSINCTTP